MALRQTGVAKRSVKVRALSRPGPTFSNINKPIRKVNNMNLNAEPIVTPDQKAILNILGAKIPEMTGISSHEWLPNVTSKNAFILLCEHYRYQESDIIPLPKQFRYDAELPPKTDSHGALANGLFKLINDAHDAHLSTWFNSLSEKQKDQVNPTRNPTKASVEKHAKGGKSFPECCAFHKAVSEVFGFDADNLPAGWDPVSAQVKLDTLVQDVARHTVDHIMKSIGSDKQSSGNNLISKLMNMLKDATKDDSDIKIIGGNLDDMPQELKDILGLLFGGDNEPPEDNETPDWMKED